MNWRRHWQFAVGAILALVWLALAIHGATRLSATIDEVVHIGAGLAIDRHFDFRMNPEHPPLFKALATLPASLFADIPFRIVLPTGTLLSWVEGQQWGFGYFMLFLDARDARQVLFFSRLVPMATGLCGGLLAWWWASTLAGRTAGLFAFTALLFYPEYLGHARYVTFDVPTLVSCAAISGAAWQWRRRPSWKTATLWIAASSILALVKLPVIVFSVMLWITMLGLVIASKERTRVIRVLVLGVGLALGGFLFQWVGAGFRFSLSSSYYPLETPNLFVQPAGEPQGLLLRSTDFIRRHRLLPEGSIATINCLTSFGGRQMILFDEISRDGWWYYLFVTVFYKTPLLYLAMLPLIIVSAMRTAFRGRSFARERMLFFLLPFLGLLALQVSSKVSIGHRHGLFMYFPWCVLLGVLGARLVRNVAWRGAVAGLCLAGLVALCILHQPYQAIYFNSLAGGSPERGSMILADSNIDWGESLPGLADELKRLDVKEINLAYYGMNKPEAFGVPPFRFILPGYSFAIGMPEAQPPDAKLFTAVSLNCIGLVRNLYPGRFDGKPLAVIGGIMLFPPEEL